MVPIDRNNGLFHILCGYNKNDFNEFSVICKCKGFPSDVDKETAFWLEDLAFTSYLSLEEIQNFDCDKEVYYFEEDCKHSEIACEFYTFYAFSRYQLSKCTYYIWIKFIKKKTRFYNI